MEYRFAPILIYYSKIELNVCYKIAILMTFPTTPHTKDRLRLVHNTEGYFRQRVVQTRYRTERL